VDYARNGVRWLLGATAHPGGEALTRHVLDRLGLPTGSLVADVACGDGATLRLLAARGLLGVGVDLEARAVARAGTAVVGDAQALPLRSGTYDAVLCECAVSTFDVPARALAEMARVLRPGGWLAMTDVLLRRDLAAPEVVAAVDRLTTARAMPDYVALVEAAGLRVERTEERPDDALALCRRLARRLRLVGASRHASTARACAQAVEAGALSYGVLVAVRPV
jgi:ubiquinone/menaquinone biosynthesis C-methylase UbiE